jgi:hypothetical protein
MKKKKPFKTLEERLKYHYIVIEVFKRRNVFSFGLSTSIGLGGVGLGEEGAYPSLLRRQKRRLAFCRGVSQIPAG